MDYAEEQEMELEALEAIIGEDGVKRYEATVPEGWDETKPVYKVAVLPDLDEASEQDLSIDLLFQHTDTYPEELPRIKVSNTRGLTNADAAALLIRMQEEATENIGMASVFSIMQAGKEWLESKAGATPVVDPEAEKKAAEEEVERQRLEKRAHGTPVTEETFAVWRKAFDEEMALARIASGQTAHEAAMAEKVSGRQWFQEKDRPELAELSSGDELSDGDFGSEIGDEDDDEEDDSDDDEMLDAMLAETA